MEFKRNKPVFLVLSSLGILIGLVDVALGGDIMEHPRHFLMKPDPSDPRRVMLTLNPMIGNPKIMEGIKNCLRYEITDQEMIDGYFTAVTGLAMPSTEDVLKANRSKGKVSLE